MSDIPWHQLLNIHTQSVVTLLVFVVLVGVQEFLVQQKKYPTLTAIVTIMLPFHMMVVFYYLLFGDPRRCNTDIIWYLYCTACLPLGLIYSARCVRMDYGFFLWVGRICSFIYAGWMLWLFLAWVNSYLSDRYAGFTIPGYVHVAIYLTAAVMLVLVLRKLNLPALHRQRFKDFQCIHCGYSLERNMLSTHCPECGGGIEPQISLPASGAAAAHEKPEA